MNRSSPDLVERLDRLLPQTQCGQCGFDGCRPYAEAMARGEAGIDHCPPGGDAGARALAALLQLPALPYDRSRGEHKLPQVAWIVEADCIGCTKVHPGVSGGCDRWWFEAYAYGDRAVVYWVRVVCAGVSCGLHRASCRLIFTCGSSGAI